MQKIIIKGGIYHILLLSLIQTTWNQLSPIRRADGPPFSPERNSDEQSSYDSQNSHIDELTLMSRKPSAHGLCLNVKRAGLCRNLLFLQGIDSANSVFVKEIFCFFGA